MVDRTPGWLVCAALDPMLAPAGSAPGQRGTELDLEGVPLKETLCAVGLGDAANDLGRDLRLPLDQALPTVAGTLARLLAHGGRRGPHGGA